MTYRDKNLYPLLHDLYHLYISCICVGDVYVCVGGRVAYHTHPGYQFFRKDLTAGCTLIILLTQEAEIRRIVV
jgi:hypothetical protein